MGKNNLTAKLSLLAIILCGLTMGSFLVLSSSKSSAIDLTDFIDNVDITVPISCSLDGIVDTAHTATIPNGIYSGTYNDGSSTPYANGIGQTTLKAYCNDTEGFAIYAIGYSNEQLGNNNLIGASTNILIPTGTATSGGTSNWAMKLTKVAGTYAPIIVGTSEDTEKEASTPNFTSFQPVPSTYTRVAYKASATDIGNNPTGSGLTTTYAAYIASTQAADTYNGKVLYTLVHPHSEEPAQPRATEAGKICYYANASSAVGTMGCQTIPTSGGSAATVTPTSAVLLASNFSRDGYGFAGWNDKFDYTGNFYGPQEYIEFTQGQYSGDNPGLSLYAVWVKSAGSLQDSTTVASVCNNLTQSGPNVAKTLNSVSALTDQRDNQTYAIAKLADGNCWMIENLRLEAESSTNESLAQGFGKSTTYGNFAGLATAESANFTNTDPPVANTKYSIDGSDNTISIGSGNYAYARMPRYNNLNTQSRATNPTTNSPSSTVGIYSYGNYYTWSTAMANTIYYSGPTATDADGKTSETVNTSLCPAGWRLPYGRNTGNGATSGGFSYLDIQLGGAGAYVDSSTTPTGAEMSKVYRTYPNNFLYSGFFSTSSASSRGGYGYYWSSTAFDYGNSYSLYFGSSLVYPGTSGYVKYSGFSVRCMVGSGS